MQRNRNKLPRTDIGGAGLAGALMVFVGMILNGNAFDFHAVAGALTALIVFGAGYAPERHKNVIMAGAAFAAIIGAYLVGLMLGVEGDKSAVSAAIVGLTMALIGYLAPPNANTEAVASYNVNVGPPPARPGLGENR